MGCKQEAFQLEALQSAQRGGGGEGGRGAQGCVKSPAFTSTAREIPPPGPGDNCAFPTLQRATDTRICVACLPVLCCPPQGQHLVFLL